MTQILCHLIGDYVLQSHVMAMRKTTDLRWAVVHAIFYGVPFLAIVSHLWQWLIIVATHAVIDRYGVAARWCRWYGVGHPGLWAPSEGFVPPPPFLGWWLVIIVDNTLHLLINYLTLEAPK